MIVAELTLKRGGGIAIEWPASCSYWGWERVKAFLVKRDMTVVRFDGCMLGVVSRKGPPY